MTVLYQSVSVMCGSFLTAAAAACQLAGVHWSLGWSLHSVGVRQWQVLEASENNGETGKCPLWLLAVLPSLWAHVPLSLLCQCTGCGEIEEDGINPLLLHWELGGPLEWPSSQPWILQSQRLVICVQVL